MFVLIGSIVIGENFRKTHIWFRNITEYGTHFYSNDEGYNAVDPMFEGYFFLLQNPVFFLASLSWFGRGVDFYEYYLWSHWRQLLYSIFSILFYKMYQFFNWKRL